MNEFHDGAYGQKVTLYEREAASPEAENHAVSMIRRSIGADVFDMAPLDRPFTVQLTKICEQQSHPFPAKNVQVVARLRLATDLTQSYVDRSRMMHDFIVANPPPPPPLRERVAKWFRRTWREVHEYNGPTGYEKP